MEFRTKGERLCFLRKNKGLSMDEAGQFIKKSRQVIYKYEHNIITNIPSDTIQDLANLYGSTPAFIMGWSQFPYSNPDISDVDWVGIFKQNLKDEWEEIAIRMDSADYQDSNARTVERMVDDILNGETPLTFIVACDIADKLSVSMDKLLGRDEYENAALAFENSVSELDRKIINYLKTASPEKKAALLVLIQNSGPSV